MRWCSVFLIAIAAGSATAAYGQSGLYGSPDVLRLPQMGPAALPANNTPTSDGAAPALLPAQTAPATAVNQAAPGPRPLVAPVAFATANPMQPGMMPQQPYMPQQAYAAPQQPYMAQQPYMPPQQPYMAAQPYYGAYAAQAPAAPGYNYNNPNMNQPRPVPPAPRPEAVPVPLTPIPARSPSVVDQMLQEAPPAGAAGAYPSAGYAGSPYTPGAPAAPAGCACGARPVGMADGGACGCGSGYGGGACGTACGMGCGGACGGGCGLGGGGYGTYGFRRGCGGGCGMGGGGACGGGYGGAYGACGYGAAGPAEGGYGAYGDVAQYGRAPECNDLFGGCGERCEWYASAMGLVMGHNSPNRVWVSDDNNHQDAQLMNSSSSAGWSGGVDVRLGHRFCCDTWSVDAGYWTLAPFTETQCAPSSDSYGPVTQYGTPQDWRFVQFNGVDATNYFDTGITSPPTLTRRDELHSADITIGYNLLNAGCGCNWDVALKCGPRFFRWEDSLQYQTCGTNGYAEWKDDVTNDLWGFQAGFDVAYYIQPCLRVFASTRMGIFDNHMQGHFEVCANGYAATANQPNYPCYPVDACRDDVAFLGQIDLGVDWEFAHCWSLRAGYRVVAATGIAWSDSQVPQYMVDTPEVSNIKNNGELIVSGVFAGLCWNF